MDPCRSRPFSSPLLPALLLVAVPMAGGAQEVELRWSGEIRLRTEAERPARTGEGDVYTLMRTRLGVTATLPEGALLHVQLQDGRIFGEERSTTDASADAFDLHQGYLQLEWLRGEVQARARAGRQELHLGSTRFVGAPQWGNAGRSFDALRLDLGAAGGRWGTTTFVSTVQERGNRFAGAGGRPVVEGEVGDHTLLGTLVTAGILEGFAFHDRGARYRSFAEVHRTTLGGRLLLSRLTLEAARQVGRHRAVQSAGDTVSEELGGWFAGGVLRLVGSPAGSASPRVLVGTEVYSGDDTPGSGRSTAFHILYPSVHDIQGLMDLFTDPAAVTREGGLVDAFLRASLPLSGGGPARAGPLSVDLHRFSLARGGAGAGTLGWELDLVAPLRISPSARVALGYGLFRNGPGAPRVGFGPEGELWHWGYLQVSMGF